MTTNSEQDDEYYTVEVLVSHVIDVEAESPEEAAAKASQSYMGAAIIEVHDEDGVLVHTEKY